MIWDISSLDNFINIGGFLISILLLVYFIRDRKKAEDDRIIAEEKRELLKEEEEKRRYEDLRKRIYNLEIASKALIEYHLGDADTSKIKSEVLELLYKNPGWKGEDPLMVYLAKIGWKEHYKCQK